eukprot:TRINITY_DN44841_c0_g1_i1.p1 TRINITY_DN44841_c0_g1~~TRINITY_DN44841_c0_g1_i1.p1  ORF type:complete len:113 (-),score=5.01 TRINITY_DN44841_c0_g1_i1:174-467(-)
MLTAYRHVRSCGLRWERLCQLKTVIIAQNLPFISFTVFMHELGLEIHLACEKRQARFSTGSTKRVLKCVTHGVLKSILRGVFPRQSAAKDHRDMSQR